MNQQHSTGWSPPGVWLKRSQLYVIICWCAGAAILVGMLEKATTEPASSSAASFEPGLTNDPPTEALESAAAAMPAFEPREAEATQAGYSVLQAWYEIPVENGQEPYIDVAAAPGYSYLILARTTADCDVDAVVSDEVKDERSDPDAHIEFHVSAESSIRVRLPVSSQNGSACVVGYGAYRR